MPYSTGCDRCGVDHVSVQLCGECLEAMTRVVEQGKKRPDGKYDFDLFSHVEELSTGGKKKNPNRRDKGGD